MKILDILAPEAFVLKLPFSRMWEMQNLLDSGKKKPSEKTMPKHERNIGAK